MLKSRYLDQNVLKNNALFLKKAAEEYNPDAHRHWGRINTHCSRLKTHF